MNWKFWKRCPVAEQRMTPLEEAVLESVIRSPELWVIRPWETPRKEKAIGADRGQVRIVSFKRSTGEVVAECGSFVFGPRFAGAWHARVDEMLTRKTNAEREARAKQMEDVLVKMFLT